MGSETNQTCEGRLNRLEIAAHCLHPVRYAVVARTGTLEQAHSLGHGFSSRAERERTVGWSVDLHGCGTNGGRVDRLARPVAVSCCVNYQGPRLLSANLQIKWGRGEVEGRQGTLGGWGQHPSAHEPCWASCGLWTLKPRLEGGLTFRLHAS